MNSSFQALEDVIRGFFASIVLIAVFVVGCALLAPSSEIPADAPYYHVPGDGSSAAELTRGGFNPDPVAVLAVYEDLAASVAASIQDSERVLARLYERRDNDWASYKIGTEVGDIRYSSTFWRDEHPRVPAGWEQFDRLFSSAMAKYREGCRVGDNDLDAMYAKFSEARELLREAQKVQPR